MVWKLEASLKFLTAIFWSNAEFSNFTNLDFGGWNKWEMEDITRPESSLFIQVIGLVFKRHRVRSQPAPLMLE